MEGSTNYNKILSCLAGGICFLYLLISKLFLGKVLDFYYSGNVPQKTILYLSIYYLLIFVSFVIAIIFLLKRKRWPLWFLQVLCTIIFIVVIKQTILISYRSFVGLSSIILLILIDFVIFLCSKEYVKLEFGVRIKDKKRKLLSFGTVFLVLLVGGVFGYYSFHYYIIFPKKRILKSYHWAPRDIKRLKDYEILNYKIKLPRNLIVTTHKKEKHQSKDYVTLANEDESIRVILNFDPFNSMYSLLGYNNSYELARRINRLSRIFLPSMDKALIADEVQANDVLDGFFISHKSDKCKIGQMYQLYNKKNRSIDGQIIITDKNEAFTEKQWEGLIHELSLK